MRKESKSKFIFHWMNRIPNKGKDNMNDHYKVIFTPKPPFDSKCIYRII